jgi:hypothetical protein
MAPDGSQDTQSAKDSTTEMEFEVENSEPCARTQAQIQPTTAQADNSLVVNGSGSENMPDRFGLENDLLKHAESGDAVVPGGKAVAPKDYATAENLLLLQTGERLNVAEDSATEHHNMDMDEHEVTGTSTPSGPVPESQLDANEQHSKIHVPLPTAARRASESNDDALMHEGVAVPRKVYDAATSLVMMRLDYWRHMRANKRRSKPHARSSAPAKRSSKSGSKTKNQERSNLSVSSRNERPNLNSSPTTGNAHRTLESLGLTTGVFPDIEALPGKWAAPSGPRNGQTASWPFLTYSLLSGAEPMTLQQMFELSIEWEPRVVTNGLRGANSTCRHSLTVSQHTRKVLDDQGKETLFWRLADKTEGRKKTNSKNQENKRAIPKSRATSGEGKGNSKRGTQTASSSPESQSPSSITGNSAKEAIKMPDTSVTTSPPAKIGESFSQESSQLPPRPDKRTAPDNEVGNPVADGSKYTIRILNWNAINTPTIPSTEQGQKRNTAPSELDQAPAAKRPRISEDKALESSTPTSIGEETLVVDPVGGV